MGPDQLGALSLSLWTLEQNSRWRQQLRQAHGQSTFPKLARLRNAVTPSARVLLAIPSVPSLDGPVHNKGISLSDAAMRVIVPCASGGPTDVITRAYSHKNCQITLVSSSILRT
jgi:hypothetical protein